MIIFKVVAFGIVASFLVILLKEQNRGEMALALLVTSAIILLILIINEINPIVELINKLVSMSGIDERYIKILIKAIGIAYVVEFGKNICIDSGESAIASKIELAGKIVIVSLSIPVITSLVELVVGIL